MTRRIVKATLAFTSVGVLATLVCLIQPAHGNGQQGKERVVKIEKFKDQGVDIKEPIEIVTIKVKGAAVKPDQKFAGDSDWLNDMVITIKNVSDKPVIYVTISVAAYYEKDGVRRRTSDGRDIRAAIEVGYGLRPALPGEPPRSYSAVPLMPGQTADVVFSGIKRDDLFGLLRREDASTDISELKLWLDHVAWYGEDDKMWSNGRMLRQDPNNPRLWLPIDDPDPPLSRRNHAVRKPKSELARLLGFNPSLSHAYPVDLPPCIYKDGERK
jgi:hypothetical protein